MGTSLHISLSYEAWEKRLRSPKHRLYDIDLEGKTAFCTACGRTKIHVPKSHTRKNPKAVCLTRYLELRDGEKEKRRTRPGRKPQHTLSDTDSGKKTAICSICGPTKIWQRFYKGFPRYDCATHKCAQERNYHRNRYSTKTTKPNAHGLSQIDEQNKTAVCSICGSVEIYIWQGKRKLARRCSNAAVSHIPEAEKIRRVINTDLINRYKAEQGCKSCGSHSNPSDLSLYSKIGRKKAVEIQKLLKLNKNQLMQKLESCEVFCLDCR